MTDVFVSYARADRSKVRLIANALTAEGFSVWWDPEIKPGAQWDAMIRKALANSAVVLTCWSKASVGSKWVLAETTYGDGAKKLVPVMVQTCSPPIPYNMVQAADLTRWRGDGDDPVWVATLEVVRAMVEAKRRMAAAAPPPGEAHAAGGGFGAGYAVAVVGAGAGAGAPPYPGLEARADEIPPNLAYRPSVSRGRMGARGWVIGLGAILATVAITGALWGGADFLRALRPGGAEAPVLAETAPAAIETSPAVASGPAPIEVAPAPIVPPEETPPEAGDQQVASTTLPPAPALPVTPPPAPVTPADPPVPETSLENCLGQFASVCRGARPAGFAADATLSMQERSALAALGVDANRPTQSGFDRCRRAYGGLTYAERTASTYAPGSILALVCGSSAGGGVSAQGGARPQVVVRPPFGEGQDRQPRDPMGGVDPSRVRDVIDRLPQRQETPAPAAATPAREPTPSQQQEPSERYPSDGTRACEPNNIRC